MLMVNQLIGFGAGGAGVATITGTAHAVSASDLTEYTFAGQAIGTAAGNRKVVVCVGAGASNRTISTLTVGGVSASLVKRQQSTNNTAEIWQAAVPTGTTADIVITFSGANNQVGIGVFAVYGAQSAAHDTGASTANPMTDNLDIPAFGVAVGVGYSSGTAARTYTWTNLTEYSDDVTEGAASATTAAEAFSTVQTGLTITCTPAGSNVEYAMALASWGPQ